MLSLSMLGLGSDEVRDEWNPYSQGKEMVVCIILVLHTCLTYYSNKFSANMLRRSEIIAKLRSGSANRAYQKRDGISFSFPVSV
jgi:hypothetical protein